MKAYKGFNKDMTCRGFRFEEGKTYEEKEAKLCKSGFHACEKPLDVFGYYAPADSVYHEVELEDVDPPRENDSKVCAKRIKIGAKLSIADLVKADVEYTMSKIDKTKAQQEMTGNCSASTNTGDYSASTNTGYRSASTNTGNCSASTNTGGYSASTNTGNCSASTNTGYRSASTNTGDCSASTNTGNCSASTNTGDYSASTNTGDCSASTNTGDYSASTNTGDRSASTNTGDCSASTNTGDCSASTNTGDYSASIVTGKESVAASLGINGKAKGALGCWIICAEWEDRPDGWHRKDVQCVLVDGASIKPDTFYLLKDGKFVEAPEDE